MMRENLYRGKKLETSVFDKTDWVYGSLIDSGNHEQVAIYPWFNGASTMSVRQLVYARMEAVDPATVGQFIGRYDKFGHRIFENDTVRFKCKFVHGGAVVRIGRIAYDERNARFYISDSDDYICWDIYEVEDIEVVHDNPELLEGGESNA